MHVCNIITICRCLRNDEFLVFKFIDFIMQAIQTSLINLNYKFDKYNN